MATRIVPLEVGHDVKAFDCGDSDLNFFLQATAGQHQRKFISKTYVLIDDKAPTEVMGFYTVALRRLVSKDDLPPAMAKRLPREVPALSLARLAVRNAMKGRGHGEYLLYHALDRAARVASEIGGYAVDLHPKLTHFAA